VYGHLEQCLLLDVPNEFPFHLLYHKSLGITPKVNGQVILGFSMEDDEVPDLEPRLEEKEKTRILEGALEIFPELEDAKIVEHRGDPMAYGPSPVRMKPVLGRIPNFDNAYITGRITLGMHLSLSVGQVMADLIADGRPPARLAEVMEMLSPAGLKE